MLYVATNGSDAHTGSNDQPWATIQHALSEAQPGDTIVVRQGSYRSARFVRGGTGADPITLQANGDVRLEGSGSGVGIEAEAVSHIVIEGFDISNFEIGIALAESSHVVIRDNTLRSNTSVGVQNWKVRFVSVEENRFLDPGDDSSSSAIQDYGVNFYYSEWVTADRNYFFGRHNQDLSFKRRVVNGSADGNTFEGCLYTCIYVGQNDDDEDGDMTSQHIQVRDNRFRAVVDPSTGRLYQARTPITVRNVTGAIVENNEIDPSCEQTGVETVASPNGSGLSAGDNVISGTTVRRW